MSYPEGTSILVLKPGYVGDFHICGLPSGQLLKGTWVVDSDGDIGVITTDEMDPHNVEISYADGVEARDGVFCLMWGCEKYDPLFRLPQTYQDSAEERRCLSSRLSARAVKWLGVKSTQSIGR